MSDLELDFGARGGGHARDGGAFYHASFRSGSRAGGACARSAHDYIAREGEFDGPEQDAAVHVESGHMPGWAQQNPREYWDAADLYERANARLYVAGDFALPRGLELEDQVEIARSLVGALTDEERLPYTFAIHAGADRDGNEHNPHVHVMISERQNDDIERPAQQWFKRANRDHPERGGAVKSREFHGRAWVERARGGLARSINEKLKERGRSERVDHRSYERQGIGREPGRHFGPQASHMVERGYQSDRLEDASAVRDYPEALAAVEQQID
jgi:MobA/MobL family